MKRSQDHTHLKRLAAISLVVVMCLSALPMLAPSASAADTRDIIYGHPNNVPMIRSPSPLHDELLAPTYNKFCGIFDITSDGTIYAAAFEESTSLVASTDGGKTFEMVHDFDAAIYGIYISEHAGKEYIWISTTGGKIYRSSDGGASFSLSLQMNSAAGATSLWSWAHDDGRILIGEYVNKVGPAAVYMSTNFGNSWSQIFNTSAYHADRPAHIHLVSIDPYTGWIYISVGDDRDVAITLLVSKNNGVSWEPHFAGTESGALNGFLAVTYPDPERVLFYSDYRPQVYEYIRSTGELRLMLSMPDPYWSAQVKTYCAITGEHGVSYMSMTEYGGLGLGHIWLTIDGSSWYLVDGDISDTKLLRIHDGIVYGRNIQFRDLTKEEAAMLIDDDRRSVEMYYDSARHMYFDQPMKDVEVTVTGKTVTNYLTNPSFEAVTDQGNPANWTIWPTPIAPASSTLYATDGERSLIHNKTPGQPSWFGQNIANAPLSGKPLTIQLSYRMDAPVELPVHDVFIQLQYTEDGTTKTKPFVIGDFLANKGGSNYANGQWLHYTGVWINPPTSAQLTRIEITIYGPGNYYFDSISLSESPTFVDQATPSGNVSFMLGDHLIEAGELAEGESKTISLPSDVWLDGLVPIVPVTGLAYTVSIDGTPVSESEQSIRETNKLLEQTIPLIVGLMVISGLITMLGKAFGRLKF